MTTCTASCYNLFCHSSRWTLNLFLSFFLFPIHIQYANASRLWYYTATWHWSSLIFFVYIWEQLSVLLLFVILQIWEGIFSSTKESWVIINPLDSFLLLQSPRATDIYCTFILQNNFNYHSYYISYKLTIKIDEGTRMKKSIQLFTYIFYFLFLHIIYTLFSHHTSYFLCSSIEDQGGCCTRYLEVHSYHTSIGRSSS